MVLRIKKGGVENYRGKRNPDAVILKSLRNNKKSVQNRINYFPK